jgi:hypothetical protein
MSETQGVDGDLFEALLHNLMFAADAAAIEASRRGATGAERAKAAVKEALECALGNGLLTVTPREEWPEYIAMSPPYKPGLPW